MLHAHRSFVLLLTFGIVSASVSSHAEIVFVDLDDLPIEATTPARLFDGPFGATIQYDPPAAEGSLIATSSGYVPSDVERAARMDADTAISASLLFSSPLIIAGFETVGGTRIPIASDWFDSSGSPVRGFIGVGSPQPAGGDPHYGWIELTVEYDPPSNTFDGTLHSFAYENNPGVPINAGSIQSIGDINNDNFVDDLDIDTLRNAILASTRDPDFNVDGVGGDVPNESDFDFLIERIIGTGRGDGDLNLVINFADFGLLSNNFGGIGTNWSEGNYNVDRVTNFADFAELSNRFGTDFRPQVPEPATWVLTVTMVLSLLRRRTH